MSFDLILVDDGVSFTPSFDLFRIGQAGGRIFSSFIRGDKSSFGYGIFAYAFYSKFSKLLWTVLPICCLRSQISLAIDILGRPRRFGQPL